MPTRSTYRDDGQRVRREVSGYGRRPADPYADPYSPIPTTSSRSAGRSTVTARRRPAMTGTTPVSARGPVTSARPHGTGPRGRASPAGTARRTATTGSRRRTWPGRKWSRSRRSGPGPAGAATAAAVRMRTHATRSGVTTAGSTIGVPAPREAVAALPGRRRTRRVRTTPGMTPSMTPPTVTGPGRAMSPHAQGRAAAPVRVGGRGRVCSGAWGDGRPRGRPTPTISRAGTTTPGRTTGATITPSPRPTPSPTRTPRGSGQTRARTGSSGRSSPMGRLCLRRTPSLRMTGRRRAATRVGRPTRPVRATQPTGGPPRAGGRLA